MSLTAARGRGKSAALGLAIAAAVGFGYSNIFVTSPSPENLHTLFDFVFKVTNVLFFYHVVFKIGRISKRMELINECYHFNNFIVIFISVLFILIIA